MSEQQKILDKWLSKRKLNSINDVYTNNVTVAHVAAYHCDNGILAILLKHKDAKPHLHINARTITGVTPLMCVLLNTKTHSDLKLKMAKFMVNKLGASVDAIDAAGNTFVGYATKASVKTNFFSWLFKSKHMPTSVVAHDNQPLLIHSTITDNYKLFMAILKQRDTPRHIMIGAAVAAVCNNRRDMVSVLVQSNPTLTSAKLSDMTIGNVVLMYKPLLIHLAAAMDACHITEFLLHRDNYMLHAYDDAGYTPLMYAVQYNAFDTVVALLEMYPTLLNEANIKNGETPLHIASRFGHTTIISYLIKAGASIHAVDAAGKMPFHHFVVIERNNWDHNDIELFDRIALKLLDLSQDPARAIYASVALNGSTPFLCAAGARNFVAMNFIATKLGKLVYSKFTARPPRVPFAKFLQNNSVIVYAEDSGDDSALVKRRYSLRYRRRSSSLNLRSHPKPPLYFDGRGGVLSSSDSSVRKFATTVEGDDEENDRYCITERNSVSSCSSSSTSHLLRRDHQQMVSSPVISLGKPFAHETSYHYCARFKQAIVTQFNFITGETAAHFALAGNMNSRNNTKWAEPSLLSNMYASLGCSMHIADTHRNTPFMVACKQGNLPCVLWLKTFAGAADTPFSIDDRYVTAFEHACASNNVNLVKWCINYMSNDPLAVHRLLNHRDAHGLSPLLVAASTGSLASMECIAAYCAHHDKILTHHLKLSSGNFIGKGMAPTYWRELLRTHITAKHQKNALFLAIQHGHIHMVDWLVAQMGGSEQCKSMTDACGRTPIQFAAVACKGDIATYCAQRLR